MKVLLAGATGVIGRQLLPLLTEAGYSVVAMTRSQHRAEALREQGAEPLVCDVFDRGRLFDALARTRLHAVIHQLTSIPARLHPRRINVEMERTNRLREEGTKLLVEVARRTGAERVLTQSVAFAYRPDGYAHATEEDALYLDAPEAFAPLVQAVARCERHTLNASGVEGVVLRYGLFYGPGTIYARGGSFAEDVLRRRVPVLGDGSGRFSFIHVGDAATATLAAVEQATTGIYNIVDDTPVPARDWLPRFAGLLGAPPPFRVPRFVGRLLAGTYPDYLMTQQRGASNARARLELTWTPRYSSWLDGFSAELGKQGRPSRTGGACGSTSRE